MNESEFNLKSASDNFLADVSKYIEDVKKVTNSLDLPEDYKRIVFTEILKAIFTGNYPHYRKTYPEV